MDMQDVEPYTLVVWDDGNLFQLVWDGERKHCVLLKPNQPYIWSSVTLYDGEARNYRSELYQQWIGMNEPVSSISLLNFFKSFTDNENGFLMNRNEQTKTLSYTFIKLQTGDSAEMQYHDFLSDTYHNKKIWFNNSTKNVLTSTGVLHTV
jgi:hypothetical protein